MAQDLPPEISGKNKKISSIYLWLPLAVGFLVMGWLLHEHYGAEEPEGGMYAPEPTYTENDYERTVTLTPGPRGHYVFSGLINGKKVNFILDTGATSVAVPESLAQYLGLWKRGELIAQTANGNVTAWATRIPSVEVGNIVLTDVEGSIMPNMPGNEVLLGMSFLRKLRMMQQGDNLQLVQRVNDSMNLPWDQKR